MYKKLVIIGLTGICLVGLAVMYQFFSISSIGESAEPQQSDVIIILGAGVWPTGPSPALSARVEHAADLFQQGFAPKLILSGGLGDYPPAEAEVMRDLLITYGVPQEALILEDQALNTEENIAYSKALMDEADLKTAIIVTDAFHLKRAMLMAQDQGIQVSGSAAKDSVLYRNQALKMRYTLREVLAIYWYYVKHTIG